MSKFCHYNGDLTNIESFSYVFPCDFADRHDEISIFGTGGPNLQGIKKLLSRLPGLKKLELIDLQLDKIDGKRRSLP